jgi:hypothetical protein
MSRCKKSSQQAFWAITVLVAITCRARSQEKPGADAAMPLSESSVVTFADEAAGRKVLTAKDEYIAALSPFDRQVRRRTDQAVTEEFFLKSAADQVVPWNDDEMKRMAEVVAAVHRKVAPFHLPLPKTVLLVKTTGQDEGNAAYTRGTAIVLPRRLASRSAEALEPLFLHELFHVISRNDAKLRDRLYSIVGFTRCGAVSLPADLAARRITNSDAPLIEHRIQLKLPGKNGDAAKVHAVPILISREPRYDAKKGGGLFDYMQFRLLVIEPEHAPAGDRAAGDRWRAKLENGQPVLLDPKGVESYHEQIGRNTNYIIHPEEVLADNFSILVRGKRDVPTPRILDELRKALNP